MKKILSVATAALMAFTLINCDDSSSQSYAITASDFTIVRTAGTDITTITIMKANDKDMTLHTDTAAANLVTGQPKAFVVKYAANQAGLADAVAITVTAVSFNGVATGNAAVFTVNIAATDMATGGVLQIVIPKDVVQQLLKNDANAEITLTHTIP